MTIPAGYGHFHRNSSVIPDDSSVAASIIPVLFGDRILQNSP